MQKMNGVNDERTTLVEEGTHFKGSLSSKCPVVVKGKIEGDLTAPFLSVSVSGAVHGLVKVGEIVSEGELSGEFEADTIRLSGVVKDKTVVRAKSLEVKLAPANGRMEILFGECTFEVGDLPNKEAAVRAAIDAASPVHPVSTANSSELSVADPTATNEPSPGLGQTADPRPVQAHRTRKPTSTIPPNAL